MNLSRLLVLASLAAGLPAAVLANSSPTIERADSGALCDRLAGNPDDADLVGQPGIAFDKLDPVAAEPACQAALSEHPDERRYLFEMARVLRKKGDFAGSIPYYEKAADKGSLIALIGLGLLYEDGDGVDQSYAKAAEYYRKAVDAGSVVAMGSLAYLYDAEFLGPDGPSQARTLYERQIDLAGDDYARINLGYLYEAGRGVEKDLSRAEALFREAVKGKDPEAATEAKNALAFMWAVNRMNLAEAEKLATEALAEIGSTDDTSRASYLDTRAWVLHQAGRDAEAVADADAAVGLDTEVPQYLNRLGDIYAALGRTGEAKAEWMKALSLPPPGPYEEPDWDAAAIQKKIDALP